MSQKGIVGLLTLVTSLMLIAVSVAVTAGVVATSNSKTCKLKQLNQHYLINNYLFFCN